MTESAQQNSAPQRATLGAPQRQGDPRPVATAIKAKETASDATETTVTGPSGPAVAEITTQAQASGVPAKPRPAVKLVKSRFREASSVMNVWCVTPETGVEFEDILKPIFWAHVAADLKPWDKIIVRHEGENDPYIAELVVRYASRTEALVKVISFTALGPLSKEVVDSEYKIVYSGAHCAYRVIRRLDGIVLKDEIPTQEQASRWLIEHLKTLSN